MWLQPRNVPCPPLGLRSDWQVVVAVPARDEAARIGTCLTALDEAAALVPRADVTVLLLVNNDREGTAAVARAVPLRDVRLEVVEATLRTRRANAGGARRTAMDLAAGRLPADGVLLTTDADTLVDRQWIAANLAELAAGADAVAGVIAFDTREVLPAIRPERALEWRLSELQAELTDLLDPRAHDPWPNHIWSWGASLAVTRAAYDMVGGCPVVPLAEDRHLARALDGYDLKLRHSHAAVVRTSPRCDGRAKGGFAQLLRTYASDPGAPCDALLEPLDVLLPRVTARAQARAVWPDPEALRPIVLGAGARFVHMGRHFGGWWHAIERTVADWMPRRLVPAELPCELARTQAVIARLRAAALAQAA